MYYGEKIILLKRTYKGRASQHLQRFDEVVRAPLNHINHLTCCTRSSDRIAESLAIKRELICLMACEDVQQTRGGIICFKDVQLLLRPCDVFRE